VNGRLLSCRERTVPRYLLHPPLMGDEMYIRPSQSDSPYVFTFHPHSTTINHSSVAIPQKQQPSLLISLTPYSPYSHPIPNLQYNLATPSTINLFTSHPSPASHHTPLRHGIIASSHPSNPNPLSFNHRSKPSNLTCDTFKVSHLTTSSTASSPAVLFHPSCW
jgi:hypothetical protein